MSRVHVQASLSVYEKDRQELPIGSRETLTLHSHSVRADLILLEVDGVKRAVSAVDLRAALNAVTSAH